MTSTPVRIVAFASLPIDPYRCHAEAGGCNENRGPARMFHQRSAAARDRAASTSLRSVAVLDVLPSTPAGGSRRAPYICSPLIAPRCDCGATSGLADRPPQAPGRDGALKDVLISERAGGWPCPS